MFGILLFEYDSFHSGPALHGVKKYSPYYKDFTHKRGGTEDKDSKSHPL